MQLSDSKYISDLYIRTYEMMHWKVYNTYVLKESGFFYVLHWKYIIGNDQANYIIIVLRPT